MAQNDFHRALQYYKQVADALGGATCHDERLECLKALYGCSEACFRINDYSASLDYLLMAEEQLQADNSLPSGRLNANYAALYVIIASQTGKNDFFRNIIEHGMDGFEQSLREQDTASCYRTFCDIAAASSVLEAYNAITPAVKRMRSLAKTTNDWRIHAGLKIYEARKAAYGDEDYSTAEKAYADAIKLLPPIAATERQRASLRKDRAAVLGLMGRTQEALKELDEVERMSYILDMRDLRLTTINVRMHIYEHIPSMRAEAEKMRQRSLSLRDSLQSVRIVDDMTQMEYLKERRGLMRTITLTEMRHRWTLYGLIGLVAVVIVRGLADAAAVEESEAAAPEPPSAATYARTVQAPEATGTSRGKGKGEESERKRAGREQGWQERRERG